nr:protein kinase-like domain, phloem protein 2-like protein [Tanacetum cinerariifolium]
MSKEFAHLKVPLENILSATNNFAQENVFGESGFAKRYRGRLLWSGELMNIFARRLNIDRQDGEQQFWMEISMLSTLKHKNLVSLVGFCDENDEKIIIYKDELRGLLINHLKQNINMTRELDVNHHTPLILAARHRNKSTLQYLLKVTPAETISLEEGISSLYSGIPGGDLITFTIQAGFL